MVRPDEERRALLFRQQQERQRAARSARNRALRGVAAPVKAIRDGWEPVRLAQLEADQDERDDCDE